MTSADGIRDAVLRSSSTAESRAGQPTGALQDRFGGDHRDHRIGRPGCARNSRGKDDYVVVANFAHHRLMAPPAT